MAITRWDPFGEVLRMQRDMDRIFSRMGAGGGRSATASTAWMPRINVMQSGEDLSVHVELAGIKPEDVDIEVTDGVLTVSGERKSETKHEDEGWVVRESSLGSFERSIVLPEGIDPASIRAEFRDGMLEIRVPKALEAAKPKTTRVTIGAAPEAFAMEAGEAETPMGMPIEGTAEQPVSQAHH